MEEVWGEAGLGILSELTFLSWDLYLKNIQSKIIQFDGFLSMVTSVSPSPAGF